MKNDNKTRDEREEAKSQTFVTDRLPRRNLPPQLGGSQAAPDPAAALPRKRPRRKPYRPSGLKPNVEKTRRAAARNDSGRRGKAARATPSRVLTRDTGFCRKTVYNHLRILQNAGCIRAYGSWSKTWNRRNPNVLILKNFDGKDVNPINSIIYPESLNVNETQTEKTQSKTAPTSAKLFPVEDTNKGETKAKTHRSPHPAFSRSVENHPPELKNAWERRGIELAELRNRRALGADWCFKTPGVAKSRAFSNHDYDRARIIRRRVWKERYIKIKELERKQEEQRLHMQRQARVGIWDGKP